MVDFNDLRLFERVATLGSFAAASRALGVPRSSVSRGVQRLEQQLGTRLLQRTTREVRLTDAGDALLARCAPELARLGDAVDHVASLGEGPRGTLRISSGIAFGVNVLSELLPAYARRYPLVDVVLDLSSAPADLVSERVDVAIRFGALPDSRIVARRLGELHRFLCASPAYLERRGTPTEIAHLCDHDLVDLPVRDGERATWRFRRGEEQVEHLQTARLTVNCALTSHRMVLSGAGIGMSSNYLCHPELAAGRLVHLLPEWTLPPVPVHAVFPSRRQLAPAVRAFIEFLVAQHEAVSVWSDD